LVNPGFRSRGALAASLSFPMNEREQRYIVGRYREILGQARLLPGVEAVGVLLDVPFDPIQRDMHFAIEGRTNISDSIARWQVASPGLMETLEIPILRGRGFADADSEDAPGVVIISELMARRYWPDRDPIGERIWFDGVEPEEHWLTIIGVAGDVRQAGLIEPPPPIAYVCYSQLELPGYLSSANLVIRLAKDAKAAETRLRKVIRKVNPETAVMFRRLDNVLANAIATQRFQTQVLAGFALMALVLGIVGMYGVLSYLVTSNQAAIGIRMALGARPEDVFGGIVRQALTLACGGSAIGLASCLSLRAILKEAVFALNSSDITALVGATVVILGLTFAACWKPAKRAMRVDPVSVLKAE
jgi:putative ABC transport system permease protein